MGSILNGVVREDCLEEGVVSRGLNGVKEQPSRVLRRAFQAKGAPREKIPRPKKKKKKSVTSVFLVLALLPGSRDSACFLHIHQA